MKRDLFHLTDRQLELLRRRLADRAQVLLTEISTRLHSGGLELDPREPEAGNEEAAVTVASVERDAEELRDIETALERMRARTYGLCAQCGCALTWARLDAKPEAPLCVDCARLRELRSQGS